MSPSRYGYRPEGFLFPVYKGSGAWSVNFLRIFGILILLSNQNIVI